MTKNMFVFHYFLTPYFLATKAPGAAYMQSVRNAPCCYMGDVKRHNKNGVGRKERSLSAGLAPQL